jgi:osmoprotectant transport system permease protein
VSDNLAQQLEALPGHLSNHLLITILPLIFGVAISLPLAILAVRSSKLRSPMLAFVSVIQTIPSLALVALMVPVLVGLSALTVRLFGVEVSAFGFYPAVIALTLYSVLPMLRNMVTGLMNVDAKIIEAARGVGMTPNQILTKVELPLALPVMVAGIRTATVWTVGSATLATPVGQRCLGNYIFGGLQTRNWTAVLFGCVAAALMAILLDWLIGVLERAVTERRRGLAIQSGSILACVVMVGLVGPWAVRAFQETRALPAVQVTDANRKTMAAPPDDNKPLIVGAKTFTEQYILAELITNRLHQAGLNARKTESLGSTVAFDALLNSDIDCYVEYAGTIWTTQMHRQVSEPSWRTLAEVSGWLAQKHGVRCLGSLGFENAYALVMTRKRAEQLGIRTIADLARHRNLKIGSDFEFFARPEWVSIQKTYGVRFADQRTFDSSFMYDALAKGDVDVITAGSSDGLLSARDLVLLEDPSQAIPPYDAVLLLSPRAASRREVAKAVEPLIGQIQLDLIRKANYSVDRETDKLTPVEAARLLDQQIRRGR